MIRHRPLITDIQPTRYVYRAGDRVIARVSCQIPADKEARLQRLIKGYTREDVRVLVVDCTMVKVAWKHAATGVIESLVDPSDIQHQGLDAGFVNLDCSVTELVDGDTLIFSYRQLSESQLVRKQMVDKIKQWAGNSIEIILLEGF